MLKKLHFSKRGASLRGRAFAHARLALHDGFIAHAHPGFVRSVCKIHQLVLEQEVFISKRDCQRSAMAEVGLSQN